MNILRISVVATVRDEVASVEGFVCGLADQTRRPDEIVIVDGGSSDGTLELLDGLAEVHRELRVVRAPGTNISAGRNRAIEAARGNVIAVSDAGTRARPDWLERLVEPIERHPEIGVSSGFFEPGGSTWFERTLSVIITPQLPEIDPATFLPSSRSVAFRRRLWERAGGYPEWLDHCEDLVFDLAMKDAGGAFAFAPDAIVEWTARSTPRGFARQYFLYARGDALAGLWSRRHAVRYAAYGVGALLVAGSRRRPALLGLLALAGSGYMLKFLRRIARHPPGPGATGTAAAVVAAPAIVALGDIAKMAGYLAGRRERRGGSGGSG